MFDYSIEYFALFIVAISTLTVFLKYRDYFSTTTKEQEHAEFSKGKENSLLFAGFVLTALTINLATTQTNAQYSFAENLILALLFFVLSFFFYDFRFALWGFYWGEGFQNIGVVAFLVSLSSLITSNIRIPYYLALIFVVGYNLVSVYTEYRAATIWEARKSHGRHRSKYFRKERTAR